MSAQQALYALTVFIFHNNGEREVIPVAIAALAFWTLAAGIYLLVFKEPTLPKFFGTRRNARWVRYAYGPDAYVIRVLPWKWSGGRSR